MLVQIETRDGDPDGTHSLFRWLSRDPGTRGSARVTLAGGRAEGYMGALDVINVFLTQATGLASLAVAIASWRDSRSGPAPLRITVGERAVEISDGDGVAILLSLRSLAGDATAGEGEAAAAGQDGGAG